MDVSQWLGKNLVYLTIAGSHAYGTNTPESDYDLRGASIPPLDYHYGLLNFEQSDNKETVEFIRNLILPSDIAKRDDVDATIWSLVKMIKLAADGNPNMIELLFPPEDCLLVTSHYIDAFFEIREAFLSRLLKHRFSGYAMQQLKRVRNHKRWIDNPPSHRPTREEYGIEHIKMEKDQMHACLKMIELQVDSWLVDQTHLPEDIKIQLGPEMTRTINVVLKQLQIENEVDGYKEVLDRAANRVLKFDSDFINFLNRYKAYKNAQADYEHYETWVRQRNPERAKLERQFDYDTKHAMHLVRLLRMAREILEGKGVIVKRPDAEELLAIRNKGIWSYEKLVNWAVEEDKALNEVMETSALPKSPNRKLINEKLVEVTSEFFKHQ